MDVKHIRCYINRIEYPLLEPLEITDHAAAADTSTIHVDIAGLPEPQALDTMYLFDGDALLFGGTVGCSQQAPTYTRNGRVVDYALEVTNMAALLARRYVNKAWTDSSIYQIVMEIYDKILAEEDIALSTVSSALLDLPATTYIAPDMTAAEVLDELAGLVGAVWTIDANPASTLQEYLGSISTPLTFYAGAGGAVPAITPYEFYDTPVFKPFRFSFVVPDDFAVSRPPRLWNVQKSVESYNLRTVQTVTGATGITDPQEETVTYQANDSKITVSWPVIEMPSITVNGNPAPVGVSGINSDNGKQWLFSYDSADIQLNTAYEPKLTGGEKIVVKYRGHFQLRVRLANPQVIADIKAKSKTSGLIEAVDKNDRINTAAGLIDYAVNQMYANATPEEQIECDIDGWNQAQPLTIWNFDLPDAHIVGDYTITERTLRIDSGVWTHVTLKSAGLLTSYGKALKSYRNQPTAIRDTEIVVASETAISAIVFGIIGRVYAPLCCFADDNQPWILGGDYYAGY